MQSSDTMFDAVRLAEGVRHLMERCGIPRRRQCKELTHILQLSFSQAHRKLSGASPWTLDQLQKITAHFSAPLDMLEHDAAQLTGTVEPGRGSVHDALFVVGERELPCSAWIGDPVGMQYRAEFIAMEEDGLWRIVENTAAFDAPGRRYQVDKVEIHIRQPHVPSIAVLDDDRGSADNLRDYLNQTGFKATAFYSGAALEAALGESAYDGYVLDWLLGSATTERLIRRIRTSGQASAPIILLTGQLVTGMANESDVARVIVQFNVDCQEKPTRLSIIGAELSRALIQGAHPAMAA